MSDFNEYILTNYGDGGWSFKREPPRDGKDSAGNSYVHVVLALDIRKLIADQKATIEAQTRRITYLESLIGLNPTRDLGTEGEAK